MSDNPYEQPESSLQPQNWSTDQDSAFIAKSIIITIIALAPYIAALALSHC